MTRRNGSPGPSLPVRPRQGETADSYLRRLAADNHLRFSYLRRYLATPTGSYGPVDPGRLAAVAGREPHAITRAFPELAPAVPRPGQRRYTGEEIDRNQAAKRVKYAAILRDDAAGMSGRAIERKHRVSRRTVTKALASAEPPARKKIHRESAALNGLHHHINAMIDEDPTIGIASIWQQLAATRRRPRRHRLLSDSAHLRHQPPRSHPAIGGPEPMTKPAPKRPPGQYRWQNSDLPSAT